jgi:hypothetical protein
MRLGKANESDQEEAMAESERRTKRKAMGRERRRVQARNERREAN